MHTGTLWGHLVQGQIPKAFRRFLHEPVGEYSGDTYLPKWVCVFIAAGHWTDESINLVANDPDMQIAFALEYDIAWGKE